MRALLLSATALLAAPGLAQAQDAGHGDHSAHAGHTAAMPEPDPAQVEANPHAGHTMPAEATPPDPHAGHTMPADPPPADPHSGHAMPADPHAGHVMPQPGAPVGNAPPPPVPTDHAADALFDPATMARARKAMGREMRFTGSMVLVDRLEYQGGDHYRWGVEAWAGGDIDRVQLKSEGEGRFGDKAEQAEVQLLWSRAVSPFWNVQLGLRHDFEPRPSRSYAVVGIEGLAPYWLHVSGQLFLSDKGDLRARVEASHDMRITQRLILQPRLEADLAAQDMPAIGVGAGLSQFELGARLRYEVQPEFAPYLGVEWSRKTGETARLSRLAGEDPGAVRVVAGIRFWF